MLDAKGTAAGQAIWVGPDLDPTTEEGRKKCCDAVCAKTTTITLGTTPCCNQLVITCFCRNPRDVTNEEGKAAAEDCIRNWHEASHKEDIDQSKCPRKCWAQEIDSYKQGISYPISECKALKKELECFEKKKAAGKQGDTASYITALRGRVKDCQENKLLE